jgi:hypothetical protein
VASPHGGLEEMNSNSFSQSLLTISGSEEPLRFIYMYLYSQHWFQKLCSVFLPVLLFMDGPESSCCGVTLECCILFRS